MAHCLYLVAPRLAPHSAVMDRKQLQVGAGLPPMATSPVCLISLGYPADRPLRPLTKP